MFLTLPSLLTEVSSVFLWPLEGTCNQSAPLFSFLVSQTSKQLAVRPSSNQALEITDLDHYQSHHPSVNLHTCHMSAQQSQNLHKIRETESRWRCKLKTKKFCSCLNLSHDPHEESVRTWTVNSRGRAVGIKLLCSRKKGEKICTSMTCTLKLDTHAHVSDQRNVCLQSFDLMPLRSNAGWLPRIAIPMAW